jgi:branched-chain amino acid aminotransferase
LFGSGGQLALQPSGEYTFCVYVLPGNSYHGIHALDALVMEEFDRAAPKGTGSAKVGGNYAPVIRWSNKALKEGYGVTLHLDSRTQTSIEEFSTSGFLGIKEDAGVVTLVVPDSSNVIESITSNSCMEMAKHLGWKTERREVCNSSSLFSTYPYYWLTKIRLYLDQVCGTFNFQGGPRRWHCCSPTPN